jgi:hypothetical protein
LPELEVVFVDSPCCLLDLLGDFYSVSLIFLDPSLEVVYEFLVAGSTSPLIISDLLS